MPRAAVSGDRIADVLETEVEIKDPEAPKTFEQPVRGKIEFRDVSFRYPDAKEDVIQNISFSAIPGQTTAFIGSTGCGKSTVINLIPRFYDVTEGSILLDGIDIRDVRQSDLRDTIGFVPQKGTLFSGTIESNLLYADQDASPEVVREALDIWKPASMSNDLMWHLVVTAPRAMYTRKATRTSRPIPIIF